MKKVTSEERSVKGTKNYLLLKKESRLTFNNRQNLLFFENSNFIKVNLPTNVGLRRN